MNTSHTNNLKNEEEPIDKILKFGKGYIKNYFPDRKEEPRWYKIWNFILIIITILVLLSAWECYNMRLELGREQTRQYVSCPSFTWNGTFWIPNETIDSYINNRTVSLLSSFS